jgi:ABC-type Na+ efflux pump permease subunit
MLLLPIVDRELRVAARSGRLYLGRVTTGVAALAMSLYLIWLARYALAGPMAGMFILKATSYMAWGLCVFGGVNRTSDSLSAEKRGETLGLLFLTHLKGYDVVLGKLLASGFNAVLLLLGVLPILSIPVLLGGVAATEMVRIPVALFTSLLLALSIGLLVSTMVRSQRAATGIAGGIIVFLAVLLPALAQVTEREWQWPELARILRIPSPLCAQEMAFTTAFGLSTNDFWKSVLLQFAMALAALISACKIAPNCWQIRGAKDGFVARLSEKFIGWTHGTAELRKERRTRLLTRNPWFWLSFRDRFAPLWPFVFAIVVIGAVAWCIGHYEIPKPPACALLFAALAINDLTMRMRVASLAATRLGEDRQSGALEMILSTPLTVREIVKGQWMAIRKIQLKTFCALAAFYLVLSAIYIEQMETPADAWWVIFSFLAVSIGDFAVLGYVAMWKGMRVANARHAAGAALVRVLLVPWFTFLGCLPLIQKISFVRQAFNSAEPFSFLALALVIWIVSSITALLSARRNIARHFREAATDRYLFEERFKWFRAFRRSKQTPQNFERAPVAAI